MVERAWGGGGGVAGWENGTNDLFAYCGHPHKAFWEVAGPWLVSTDMTVFTPVTPIRAFHAGQAPREERRNIKRLPNKTLTEILTTRNIRGCRSLNKPPPPPG